MLGLSIGVASLVARYLGAERPEVAERTGQPGVAVGPRTLAVNYFRPCRPQAGNLLARGRVVNTSRFFAFTALEIEDPEGRHIAHAAGQSAFRVVEPPPPVKSSLAFTQVAAAAQGWPRSCRA